MREARPGLVCLRGSAEAPELFVQVEGRQLVVAVTPQQLAGLVERGAEMLAAQLRRRLAAESGRS